MGNGKRNRNDPALVSIRDAEGVLLATVAITAPAKRGCETSLDGMLERLAAVGLRAEVAPTAPVLAACPCDAWDELLEALPGGYVDALDGLEVAA